MHKNGVAILNWYNKSFQYEVIQKFYILKMGIIKKAVMKVSFTTAYIEPLLSMKYAIKYVVL